MLIKLMLVSGAASVEIYSFNGRRIILLGDKHYTTQEECEDVDPQIQCTNFNKQGNVINRNDECWNVAYWIYDILEQNEINESKTDIYLEYPYALNKVYKYTGEIKQRSALQRIEDILSRCLIRSKLLCPFQQARIHYIDVRQTLEENNVSQDYFIRSYFNNQIKKIVSDEVELTEQYISDFTSGIVGFIKFCLTVSKDIKHITLDHTKDYIDEMKTLFSSTNIAYLDTFKQYIHLLDTVKHDKSLITTRDGRRVHKTAVQLLKLESKNKYYSDTLRELDYSVDYEELNPSTIVTIIRYSMSRSLTSLSKGEMNIATFVQQMKEVEAYIIVIMQSIVIFSMDVYVLGRMLYFEDSEDVIIFAGEIHIVNYRKLFDALRDEIILVDKGESLSDKCKRIYTK